MFPYGSVVYSNAVNGGGWKNAQLSDPYPIMTDLAHLNGYLYGVGDDDNYVYRAKHDREKPENNEQWSKFNWDMYVTRIIIYEDIIYGIGYADNAVYMTRAEFTRFTYRSVSTLRMTLP